MDQFAPDLAIEQQLLAQKQKLAEMLAQRAGQPIQAPGGGSLVSPLQVAAQVYTGHQAGQARQGVEQGTRALGEKYNQLLASGIQEYMAKKNGTAPAVPMPDAELGGGPAAPAGRDADPRGAMVDALTSRNPLLRSLGTTDYAHELKKTDPYTLNEGDRRIIPGTNGGTTTAVDNPKTPVHQIPPNWESHLPQGAERLPADPPGVFRMAGTDGQKDVYYLQYERGQPTGYKKLDSSQTIRDTGASSQTTTTIQDPLDPTKTLVVKPGSFDAAKFAKGDKTGVVGPGPKPSTEGVARSEGFATFQSVNSNLDKLDKQIDTVLNSKLSRTVGLPGMLPNVPGFAGADAEGRLEALKSMIGFDVLQALRGAAHNGASGLGQVTEKEHVYLQSQLGNLKKAQSEAEIRKVVGEIKDWVSGARQRYQQAYEARFNAGQQPAGAPKPPEGFKPL